MTMVRLKAVPVKMVIIHFYMPTSRYTDEEMQYMYQRLEDLMSEDKDLLTSVKRTID